MVETVDSSQSGVSVALQSIAPPIQSSQSGVSAVLCVLPAAATSLDAIGHTDHVDLTWTDNVIGLSNGYRVERQTNGGTWETLDTVGPGEESYKDSAIVPGSTYAYRIVATNGLCETESAPVAAVFSHIYVYDVLF